MSGEGDDDGEDCGDKDDYDGDDDGDNRDLNLMIFLVGSNEDSFPDYED